MTRRVSLQRRLAIGLALGVTATWLAATVGAGLVVRHELDEAFDSSLQETAQRVLALAVIDVAGRDAGASPRSVAQIGRHRETLTYLVRDRSGRIRLRSHDADPRIFPDKPVLGFRSTATHRLYGEAAVGGTVFIEVAEPLAHRRDAAFEATVALFIPLLILVPFSLLGVWWLVRGGMRPILALRGEIE